MKDASKVAGALARTQSLTATERTQIARKAALVRLGVWPSVENRIARTENVRAALALVARREAPLGIVYATDARAAPGVRVIGRFAPRSHPAISYPLAVLRSSANPDAEAFRRFLISREGRAIFARFGFGVPGR